MTHTTQRTTPDVVAAATLDCSGLLCPLPVYKTALALSDPRPATCWS